MTSVLMDWSSLPQLQGVIKLILQTKIYHYLPDTAIFFHSLTYIISDLKKQVLPHKNFYDVDLISYIHYLDERNKKLTYEAILLCSITFKLL